MATESHSIREYAATTTFAGDFPQITPYAGVDMEMLTAGDPDPFFITLQIAEVGRTSANGLLYDRALVEAIARQLQGLGGIQGHIPAGEEGTSYPIDAVDWVGHVLEQGVLWAKAYVPPGATREMLRRLKARTGKIGTSIYGYGEREIIDEDAQVWRSQNFELHSVDLAPAKMAALQLGGDFLITSETQQNTTETESEAQMPTEITLADVPDRIREQIIHQAQLETDAERVSELEDQVAHLTSRITELESERETGATRISELEATLNERDQRIAEYEATAFRQMLDERIAEATDWQIHDAHNRDKLAALRQRLRRDILAELAGEDRNEAAVETAMEQAFADNQFIIETMRDALAGPAASISGIDQRQTPDGDWESYKDNPGQLTQRWGTALTDS